MLMRAKVKSGLKLREGKGFSLGELKEAKLKSSEIHLLKLRIDKRRRSIHDFNISKLIELKKEFKKRKKIRKKIRRKPKKIRKIEKLKPKKKKRVPLQELKGVGERRAKSLEEAGIKTIDDLLKADLKKLQKKTSMSEKYLSKLVEKAKEI
ncbi:MAG: ribosomal protein L13e [Candidatus Methanofastidiosia archaeon]